MGGRAGVPGTHSPVRRTVRQRARLDDVAALAGVGIATVDRVLNERGNVAPETARKIIEAARQLGLPRTLPGPLSPRASARRDPGAA